MTSRVQKGGAIFKPLIRPKSRPAAASQNGVISRQTSVVAEAPASSSTTPSCPPSPPTVPLKPANVPATPTPTATPSSSISRVPKPINSQPAVPPSIAATQVPAPSVTVISSQSPARPTPILKAPQANLSTNNFLVDSISENPSVQFSSNKDTRARRANTKANGEPATQSVDGGEYGGVDVDLNHDDSSGAQSQPSKVEKPKRKRRASAKKPTKETVYDDDGTTEEAGPTKRRKRANKSSSSNDDKAKRPRGKGRRSRSSSLPPFDPNADPGEDLDPTVVTMASLCSDTGKGRVSSKAQEILNNHAVWKASNRERRARMKAVMERKKYGLPEEEDEAPAASSTSSEPFIPSSVTEGAECSATTSTSVQPAPAPSMPSRESVAPDADADADADADPDAFDYSQNLAASRFNIQVRIGPNGETIIDEESMFVDRAENAEDETAGYTHVIESDRSKFTNSSTYGKKLRGTRWSAAETELFYEALAQYGENYEMISYVLPGRDRKSCKNKFKAEDKRNPARINHCLNNSIPVDINTLSRMTGRDFTGPVPEVATPKPPELIASTSISAAIQAQGSSSELGNTQEKQQRDSSTSAAQPHKTRKRSHSRTSGPPEEGLTIIGDLDTFVDND